MLLEGAANERKLKLKSSLKYQKQKVQNKMSKIAKLDENSVKVQEQAARVERIAQQFVDSIIAIIEAKKMEFFDDVKNKVKESLEHLGMKRREIEEQVKMHEVTIEQIETLLKRSTSAQIMQPNEFLDKIFQEKGDQEDADDRDGGGLSEFDFVKNEKLFDHVSDEQIGSLLFLTETKPQQSSAEGKGISEATVGLEAQITVITRNAKREQCHEERDYVGVEIRNRQGHDCTTKVQVQDNKDGTYKISYVAKETGTCQASVKVNGEHVRGSPFEVQVKPRQFRPVLSLEQEGSSAGKLRSPWGVAVNERNEIALTDAGNCRVQIFSSNGTHLKSFGRRGDKQGEFFAPYGIAFHNDNIIVTDCGNHRVQLLSGQGEFLGQFGGKGSLDYQLKSPHGLSIDSDGNIIVADLGNKLIKIFSNSGQFLHKIGTEGSLTKPIHCIQRDNFLIVSDNGDHCIKVFDKEGNFLYRFGKKGDGDGEFNEPRCLSVNKAGHLMVCDKENHRVQVFHLSGIFITKFETNNSKARDLNCPISTAVLDDGRIVVSDLENHRIQILE